MFLDNKYTKWYNSIIDKAKSRILCSSIYTEKHHIIPKSMNGSNDVNNIVILTPREHFVCHLLLTKMVLGAHRRSMWYASYMMCRGTRRYKPNARTYEKLKQNMIAANKERPGPNLGRVFSAEARANMSASTKGVPRGPHSAEHIQNMRKPKTEEHKRHLSESRLGKSWGHKHTDDTKLKMSNRKKGIPKEKVKCKFCEREISMLNHVNWHGEKCKHNPNQVLPTKPIMNSIIKCCEYCGKETNIGSYTQWHGEKCKFKC